MRFVLATVILCLLAHVLKKDDARNRLLTPASIFTIFMSIMMICALLLENGEYGYHGYYWLIAAMIAINIGDLLATMVRPRSGRSNTFVVNTISICKLVLYVSVVLDLIAIYNYFQSGGISHAAETAYEYYTSEATEATLFENIVNQALGITSMLISMLGGLRFVLVKEKRVTSFIVFIYPLINMLYSTQKLGIIVTTFYFLIGMLVGLLYQNKTIRLKAVWRLFKKYWFIIPAFAGLFVVSFIIRFGQFSVEVVRDSFRKLFTYAFGSVQCFNAWLSTYTQAEYGLGINTFMGIPHALGLIDRVAGLYDELYTVGVGNTNVFLAFRPLIEDYGIYGGLVFLLGLGLISGLSFDTFKRRKTLFSFFGLAITYLYFIYSIITSPYIYLNISASFIMYCIAVKLYVLLGGKQYNAELQRQGGKPQLLRA